MSIIVNVDVMLAKRKMTSGELAEKVGITAANLSIRRARPAPSASLRSTPSARPSTVSLAIYWSIVTNK